MVSLEDAVIARLEAGGHRFEILIDPNEAQAFKEGDEIDWEDSIAVDGIWADSAKGERSPENILNDLKLLMDDYNFIILDYDDKIKRFNEIFKIIYENKVLLKNERFRNDSRSNQKKYTKGYSKLAG